jgi:predicted PurR-regulated permease PerM
MADTFNIDNQNEKQQSVIFAAAIILLLALVYITLPAVNPFIITVAVVFLLYPYRTNAYARRLIIVSFLFFFVWLLYTLSSILIPFIVALVASYIVNPAVTWLEKKKVPRWGGALLVLTGLLGSVVLFFILLMPIVVVQFQNILSGISTTVQENLTLLREKKFFETLSRYGLPIDILREYVEKELPNKLEGILKPIVEGIFSFLTSLSALLAQVLNIVIIPFVMFYLMKDFREIVHYVESLFPPQHQQAVQGYLNSVDDVLGQYFRGAIFVAIIQGVIASTVLSFLGVPYSLVLGVMTALLDFVPYVGLLVSLVVSSIVSLLGPEPSLGKLLGIGIMYLGMKIFENGFLAPKIIGTRIGVHPVVLILSLFIFSYFLGFVGLLIAVPSTAVIALTFRWWREQKNSRSVSPTLTV